MRTFVAPYRPISLCEFRTSIFFDDRWHGGNLLIVGRFDRAP